MAEQFTNFVKGVKETVLESIDIEYANYLVESLDVMVTELIKKKEQEVDITMCKEHLPDLLFFLIKCLTAYTSFKLQRKDEPEDVKENKKRALKVMKDLTKLSDDESKDFLDSQIVKIVDSQFCDII